MRELHRKNALECAVFSLFSLERLPATMVCETSLSLMSEKWSNCLGPCPLRWFPAQFMLQIVLGKKAQEKCNASSSCCARAIIWAQWQIYFIAKGMGVYFDDPNFEIVFWKQEKAANFRQNRRKCRVATLLQSRTVYYHANFFRICSVAFRMPYNYI